jgi:hypothetical protein
MDVVLEISFLSCECGLKEVLCRLTNLILVGRLNASLLPAELSVGRLGARLLLELTFVSEQLD